MNKEQLTKKAESLGIDVDGRWSNERIQQEIDQKEADNQAKAGATAPAAAPEAPQPSAPLSPNQPTGTDSTNGLPFPRFTPADDTPPPKIVGQTPGETPRPIPETVKPNPKEKTITVVLKADYWPEEGDRKKAGESLDIPATKAKELIRDGKASLPVPGDD